MSSKRKWDQPAPGEEDVSAKVARTDESKSASEAAAAAAAIAAKIAAQFAGGSLGSPSTVGGGSAQKDMHDAEFTFDIDINDLRNRYLLTKGSTQDQVCCSIRRVFTQKFMVCPCRSTKRPAPQ
jgi:hypothetical protein